MFLLQSPVLKELLAEKEAAAMHKAIIWFLKARFGPVPAEVSAALGAITDEQRLQELV